MKNKTQLEPITFIDVGIEDNALERWWQQHTKQPNYDEEGLEKEEQAIELAIRCVNDGSLTSIDGPDSPLSKQIKEHFSVDLIEMNSHWMLSSQHWVCPCCGRSKFDIARLGKKGQILAKLVIHHDHIQDALKAAFYRLFVDLKIMKESQTGLTLIERIAPAFSTYGAILICEDCNNVDAKAKLWLKENAKHPIRIEFHSFSIGQIRYFIKPQPHSSHEINYALLDDLWLVVKPAYIARMKLIYEVAKAAITEDYWYEGYPVGFKPIPTLVEDNKYPLGGRKFVNGERYVKAIEQQTYKPVSDWSRWRTENRPNRKTLPPPDNHLAILKSLPGCAKSWDSVADNWCCAVCHRTKYQVITNIQKKVRFNIQTISKGHNDWNGISEICMHCFSVISFLKQELVNVHQLEIKDNRIHYHISPAQLNSIIESTAHAPHKINQTKARMLVEQMIGDAAKYDQI